MPNIPDDINWIDWCPYVIKAANNVYDGTGTPNWVAGPYRKTVYLKRIRFSAGDDDNIQSVGRIFSNNGNDHAVAANNVLISEKTLTATTAASTTKVNFYEVETDLWLPDGYRVNVLLGTAVSGGYYVSAFIGQYSEVVGDPALYST